MASDFGFHMSVKKIKGMAAGQEVDVAVTSEQEKGGSIVDNFAYLGSNISSNEEIMIEIDCRIAKAYRSFGCLLRSKF